MRRAAIERLLPLAYQRAATDGSVLDALLEVMEALHAPDEAALEGVDALFTPYRSPDRFVAYLTRWTAMDHAVSAAGDVAVGRLRDLVAEGAALAQWRGTPYGMRRLLAIATGVDDIVVEEPADVPFHLRVRVPAAAADKLPLITRLVRAEKPAATTCEVVLDPAPTEEEPTL
jgi:phage tail-like protein